jgi:hypothetical protein
VKAATNVAEVKITNAGIDQQNLQFQNEPSVLQ